MGRLAVLVLMCAALARPAVAENLVVALSTDVISVTSEFDGAQLTVFGVIERDAMTVARRGGYEIAILVEGPPEDVLVQAKRRVAGVWINGRGETMEDLPSYRALFATQQAGPFLVEGGRGHRLTLDAMSRDGAARSDFRTALVADRIERGLYMEDIGGITMLTRSSFRTVIPLPGTVDDGIYTVTTVLFADGVRLDTHTEQFVVTKVGFEQRIFSLSRNSPLVYGLAVVALALVTGYVGGVVFRRA